MKIPTALFATVLLMSVMSAMPPLSADDQPSWQDSLTLPLPGDLSCCWHQEQVMQIAAPGTAIAGSAVVRREGDELGIAISDHADREVAKVRHDTEGAIHGPDAGNWSPTLSKLVLLAVYLQQLDPGGWLEGQPGWSLIRNEGRIDLLHDDQLQARIDYRDPPEAGAARAFSLAAQGYALNMEITARSDLPRR